MVIYSATAIEDLENILYGLITWQKHPLSIEHADRYVDELQLKIDAIGEKKYHRSCNFKTLVKYGRMVFVYKRNVHTQWNIIYNWQPQQRIAFINKIVNNHLTK